jgi:hypothetical protein
MIRGSPGDVVAMRYKKSKNISIDLSDAAATRPKINIHEINFQMSVAIREYLASLNDTLAFKEECAWAESIFKRIDERFAKLTDEDGEQARNFSLQIMMELERRKV